jgi:hypothetical protein
MNGIYQVTIRGRKLESRDLRRLLARAVAEKKAMDHRLRLFASLQQEILSGSGATVASTLCIEKVPIR